LISNRSDHDDNSSLKIKTYNSNLEEANQEVLLFERGITMSSLKNDNLMLNLRLNRSGLRIPLLFELEKDKYIFWNDKWRCERAVRGGDLASLHKKRITQMRLF
jgi:hypothetical protein